MKTPAPLDKADPRMVEKLNAILQDLARDVGPENAARRAWRILGVPFEIDVVTLRPKSAEDRVHVANHALCDRAGRAVVPDSWFLVDITADARIWRPQTPLWTADSIALRIVATTGGTVSVAVFRRN